MKTDNLSVIEALLLDLYMSLELLVLGHQLNKDPKTILDDFVKHFNIAKDHGLGAQWQSRNMMYKMIYFNIPQLEKALAEIPTFSASPLDTAISELINSFKEFKAVDDDVMNGITEGYQHGVHDGKIKELLPESYKHVMSINSEIEHTKKRLRDIEEDIYNKKISLGLIGKEC